MDAQPRRPMQTYNPLIGAVFALAGIGALLTHDVTIGGAFLSLSAAFFVYGRDTRAWADIPRWKRLTTLALIFLGAVFLVVALATSFGR